MAYDKIQVPTGGEIVVKDVIADAFLQQMTVTYDLERLMAGATKVSCSGFGDAIVANM